MSEQKFRPEIQEKKEQGEKRLIVEIGTGFGAPFFRIGKRKLQEGEQYISVDIEQDSAIKTKNFVDRKQMKDAMPVMADARKLPFANETVDEMVFSNVFGQWVGESQIHKLMLAEVVRVLKKGGKVTITENYSPGYLPMDMQVQFTPGQEPAFNQDFYAQLGLRVVKISQEPEDINEYQQANTRDKENNSFQLVLVKD